MVLSISELTYIFHTSCNLGLLTSDPPKCHKIRSQEKNLYVALQYLNGHFLSGTAILAVTKTMSIADVMSAANNKAAEGICHLVASCHGHSHLNTTSLPSLGPKGDKNVLAYL